MSRIHDALRRARRPTPDSGGRRVSPPQVTLAAFGFRSDRSSGRIGVLLAVVVAVALAALAAWSYWPVAQAPTEIHPPAVRAHTPSPPPQHAPARPAGPASVTASAASTKPPTVPVSHAASPRVSIGARPVTPVALSDVRTPPAVRTGPQPPAPDEFQLGLYYQRTGDFEQALLHYRKLLQQDELNLEAHNNLGMLYQNKGLYEEAAREFQRVLAINPAYPTAHLNLSAAYLKLGRADAAAAEARAVLAIDSRNSDALVNLALAQQAAGQRVDAHLSLRRALEINPQHAAAHYNLAQVYDRAGEAALAAEHYRQFLQLAGPEQAPYLTEVRERLQALGRGDK